jgi:NUMOD4 motif.
MWYNCSFLDNAYAVNEFGEIRSNERYGLDGRIVHSKILKPYEINTNYLVVDLRYNGERRRYLVHRLVYCTINNIDINTNLVIHHKDHNRHNNSISNLDIITQSENIREYVNSEFYKPKSEEARRQFGARNREIHRKRVAQIDFYTGRVIRIFDALMDVQRILGFEPASIARVCRGQQKSSYGYFWLYLD